MNKACFLVVAFILAGCDVSSVPDEEQINKLMLKTALEEFIFAGENGASDMELCLKAGGLVELANIAQHQKMYAEMRHLRKIQCAKANIYIE